MIKLIDLLKENTQSKYEFGCVMLYFNFPELIELQNKIDPSDLYTEEGDIKYGLEDEPHCTLLYGLHEEVTLDKVKDKLNLYYWGPLEIYNVSYFKNDKYDVLKFDVNGEILHDVNEELRELPYTSDFPEYHPHLTVAYLQPGMGDKYIELFKNIKYNLEPEYIIFSHSNLKDKIKIKKI